MRSWARRSGLALYIALGLMAVELNLSGQSGGFNPNASSTPASMTVMGVVVNAVTGVPVPRALVQIGGRAVLTDHDGKFEFDQFTGRDSSAQVTKPGYYASLNPYDGGMMYLPSAQLNEPMRLRLYPEALLTGTVTAAGDGEPLHSVMVSAMRSTYDDSGHRWVPAGQAQTNARGEFRIPAPAGEYRLETHYQARSQADKDVLIPVVVPGDTLDDSSNRIMLHSGEEQHFDLHPAKVPAYEVSVTMEPAEGYSVIRARMANGLSFQVNPMRASGSDIYRLSLPAGSYVLSASRFSQDGIGIAETNVTVADHDVSGVVLRFTPVQSLPVEMRVDPSTSDNATAPNPIAPNLMSLGLMLRNTDQGLDESMMNNAFPNQQKDGPVTFRVAPGSYRLQARGSGQWFIESATYGDRDLLRQEMTVAPGGGGGPIELTVSNQTGSLSGMTTVKGVPAACSIYLIPTTPSATPFISIGSNPARGYSWVLPPGIYQAVAFERRHTADWSDPATLAPFASHVRTVTIHAGDKATLDLDAVTEEEITP